MLIFRDCIVALMTISTTVWFQWARIVLVVERGVSPAQRLKKLMYYSQPMSDGRRALVLRLYQTVSEQ